MSRINGDKARFHRNRKHKIERRQRLKEMFKAGARPSQSGPRKSETKEKLA